jgi:4-nitrophenyl phosphatase
MARSLAVAIRPVLMEPQMISSLSPRITALILDMDGVVWRENTQIVDLKSVFEQIRAAGLKFVFATNNALRSVTQYQQKLAGFGVEVEAWQIVNSPMAAAFLLKQHIPAGGPVYVVGSQGLVEHLAEQGFHSSEEHVVAVVAGLDTHFSYAKLAKANRFIRSGAMFIGTNPDPTYPTPEGLGPGAGSILAAIETASGVHPLIAGKPFPAMMQIALQRLGTAPGETLVIGDRLDTDILGGQQVGCRTALMLSGVSTQEDADRWEPRPDLVAENLARLLE